MCRKARHAPQIVIRDWNRMELGFDQSSCCIKTSFLSKPAHQENWKWGCTKERKSRIAHNMLTRNLPPFAVACTHFRPQLQRCSKRQRLGSGDNPKPRLLAIQLRSSSGLSQGAAAPQSKTPIKTRHKDPVRHFETVRGTWASSSCDGKFLPVAVSCSACGAQQ